MPLSVETRYLAATASRGESDAACRDELDTDGGAYHACRTKLGLREVQGKASMLAKGDGQRELRDGMRLGRTLGFMRLLLAVDHAFDSRSKRMQVDLGITAPQRFFLRIVGRYPGISLGDVASIMEVHASTLTGVMRRLQARKFVSRNSDPQDRRRVMLRLTNEGRRLDELRDGTVEAALRRALQRSSAEDVAAAERVLGNVVEELRQDFEP